MTTLAKYYETRPLKLTSRKYKKLGPADKYPQEKDQNEDKVSTSEWFLVYEYFQLSTHFLKHGFDVKNTALVTTQSEGSSAKDIFSKIAAQKSNRGPDEHGEHKNPFTEKIINSLSKIKKESSIVKGKVVLA